MIIVINGNILAANQLAVELARQRFGRKYYTWHGGENFSRVATGFKYREAGIKGAIVRNCHNTDDLEKLIANYSEVNFEIIVTSSCSFDEPKANLRQEIEYNNNLWTLKLLFKFTLITINEY